MEYWNVGRMEGGGGREAERLAYSLVPDNDHRMRRTRRRRSSDPMEQPKSSSYGFHGLHGFDPGPIGVSPYIEHGDGDRGRKS